MKFLFLLKIKKKKQSYICRTYKFVWGLRSIFEILWTGINWNSLIKSKTNRRLRIAFEKIWNKGRKTGFVLGKTSGHLTSCVSMRFALYNFTYGRPIIILFSRIRCTGLIWDSIVTSKYITRWKVLVRDLLYVIKKPRFETLSSRSNFRGADCPDNNVAEK